MKQFSDVNLFLNLIQGQNYNEKIIVINSCTSVF